MARSRNRYRLVEGFVADNISEDRRFWLQSSARGTTPTIDLANDALIRDSNLDRFLIDPGPATDVLLIEV